MRAAAAICPLAWRGGGVEVKEGCTGGGGGAPCSGCYASRLSMRLFPIKRLSLLLLRCRPDALRTYGFTLKEALVFLSHSRLECVCVCACALTRLIKVPALQTSLGNAGREQRGVYQPGGS